MDDITPAMPAGNPLAPLSITNFERNSRPVGQRQTITWPDLCNRIALSAPTAATKDGLPLIKMATFSGDHRSDANLEAIFGVEGDYDAGVVQPAAAAAALQAAGIIALVYTSPSHRSDTPRWRVLCPLSQLRGPMDRHGLVARLNGVLGGILAPESFTGSQAFYVGSVAGGNPVECWHTEGRCIDLAEWLQPVGPTRAKEGQTGSSVSTWRGAACPIVPDSS